jgi:hypothetical protein
MEQPSTALVTTTENNATEIYRRMPDPMQAIEKMGQMFAASGMFGCTKVEQGQVLALACLIEGKSPFELMRNYHIIGGSLAMRSVGMLAEFIKRSGKVTWHSALNDGNTADATFEFNGQTLQRAAYTIKDAEKEGLVSGPNKHNWNARPADMLRARLITKAIRMIAPGIIAGVMDETEVNPAAPAAPLLATATSAPAPEEQPTLEQLLKEHDVTEEMAVNLCVERGLLEKGQTLSQLTKAARGRIQKNVDEFVKRVREHVVNGAPANA